MMRRSPDPLPPLPFDTVLVATGAVDRLVNAPETLLPVAQRKGVGMIAIKVYGHGQLKQRGLALRYALGLPGVCLAIRGAWTTRARSTIMSASRRA